MEYLQYFKVIPILAASFSVLNLIINGIPSIHQLWYPTIYGCYGFKPYYKWNTFNTYSPGSVSTIAFSFKPYYKWNTFNTKTHENNILSQEVLNLIINGIPSILLRKQML